MKIKKKKWEELNEKIGELYEWKREKFPEKKAKGGGFAQMAPFEDWYYIGEMMEKIINKGYYPGIGYDVKGGEAWVFFRQPTQFRHDPADIHKYEKSITNAVKLLMEEFEEHIKDATALPKNQ